MKNKWELVSDRALDLVLDHLNTLNDLTPKIKCKGRDGVDPNILFGLGTKLFMDNGSETAYDAFPLHNDEVETVTIYRGFARTQSHHQVHERNHIGDQCACTRNTIEGTGTDGSSPPGDSNEPIQRDILESALRELSKESI